MNVQQFLGVDDFDEIEILAHAVAKNRAILANWKSYVRKDERKKRSDKEAMRKSSAVSS